MKRHISIFALLLSAFAAGGAKGEGAVVFISEDPVTISVKEVGSTRELTTKMNPGLHFCGEAYSLSGNIFTAREPRGYGFKDWYTLEADDTDGGNTTPLLCNRGMNAGKTISESTIRTAKTTTLWYGGYVVCPKYELIKLNITFVANGGSPEPVEILNKKIDSQGLVLQPVSRSGYDFKGWKNEKGDKFYPQQEYSGENFWYEADDFDERGFYSKLTAQWEGKTYEISINPNGGAGESCPAEYTVSESKQTLTITPPTKEGHSISSWTVTVDDAYEGAKPSVSGTTLTIPANTYGKLKLTPNWNPDTFTITYKPGSGTPGNEYADPKDWGKDTALRGKTYDDPKGQYVQDGWNKTKESFEGEPDYGLKVAYTDNASITLYPHWKLNGYKLTIHHKGAYYDGKLLEETALEPLVVGATNLNEILVAVPTNGAAFYGYYSTEGGNTKIYDEHGKCCKVEGFWSAAWPDGTFAGSANLEVWAKWGPPPKHFIITAVCDPTVGGTVEPASTNVIEGDSATLTAKENTGYSFCCWTNSNGVVVSEKPEYSFTATADATYTAVFTGNVYRVRFVDDDPDCSKSPSPIYVTFGKPYGDLPKSTYDDSSKIFSHWMDAEEGGNIVTKDTIVTIPEPHWLYAAPPDVKSQSDVTFVDPIGKRSTTKSYPRDQAIGEAPEETTAWDNTDKGYWQDPNDRWDPPLTTVVTGDMTVNAKWISVSDILDCTNLMFTATGNWKPTQDDKAEKGWCMRMDELGGMDNLTATLKESGLLTFHWKGNAGRVLIVKLSNQKDDAQFTFAGEDWKEETLPITVDPSAQVTLQFTCTDPWPIDAFCAIDHVTWTPGVVTKKHTVTFTDPSGTFKTDVVQKVEEGSSANAPDWTSEKFDPTVCGWDKDFSQVMKDITVNAVWTCRVSFVDEEGGNPTETKHVEYDEAVTAPQWSRTGYTFGGWNPSLPEKVTENIELKAVWNPIYHKVTFKDPSGTCSADPQQVAYGQGATAPKWTSDKFDPTTCVWSKDFSKVMEDIEVSAVWTCRVVFVDQAGGNAPVTNRVEYGTVISEGPDFTAPKDYHSGGWDPALSLTALSNTTVSVVWTQDPMCTVTFHDPSGTFADAKSEVPVGGTATAPDWKTSKFKSLAWDKPFGPINADTTISAVWTCEIKFVDETFTHSPDTKEVTFDDAVTEPAWQQTGYTLTGWQPAFEATASSNSTYAAVWAGNVYTVTFDAKGGSAVPAQEVTYGQPYGTLEKPTLEGFSFTGWFLGETKITAGTVVTEASNHTLTAKWEKDVGELSRILDCDNLKFVPGSVDGWTKCTDFWHKGDSCLRSTTANAEVKATITEPGTLTFWWRGETDEDSTLELQLKINGEQRKDVVCQLARDKEQDWAKVSLDIASIEPVEVSFVSLRPGVYCAIDDVTWTPDGKEPEYAATDTPVTGFSRTDGKIGFSFESDGSSTYHILGTNDVTAPWKSWPFVREIKPGETQPVQIDIKADEPKMFYRIRALQ